MPWREHIDPYHVVVSEIMLQQTQVKRVMEKFPSFIRRFPTWKKLALASTADVLSEWSGLGYNRRALYLKRIAGQITGGGKKPESLPKTLDELQKLPGIGPNTAGSILAFAYNIPHPFIETNIRSVYIHFFFASKRKVDDSKILPLIEKSLDKNKPREWYYALMDYGAYLKSTVSNPSRKSIHHVRQSTFKGSNRELRSHILRMILSTSPSYKQLVSHFTKTHPLEQIQTNLVNLEKEGFIVRKKNTYSVT
jgi:A/G-specific adenine glycosylase